MPIIGYDYNSLEETNTSRVTDIFLKEALTSKDTTDLLRASTIAMANNNKMVITHKVGIPLGPKIENVIFNGPATIVIWDDKTKTIVKCSENDSYDKEKGLAMAIVKKLYGDKGSYHRIFDRWVPEDEAPRKSGIQFLLGQCRYYASKVAELEKQVDVNEKASDESESYYKKHCEELNNEMIELYDKIASLRAENEELKHAWFKHVYTKKKKEDN